MDTLKDNVLGLLQLKPFLKLQIRNKKSYGLEMLEIG